MKHLFVVHSNITYLAALGVISKEGLSNEDVRIYSTFFTVSDPLPVEILDLPAFKDALLGLRLGRWLDLAKTTEQQIQRFIGNDQFTAYIPSAPFPCNILITHRQCVGFHFIEEGASSYYPSITLDEMCKILPSSPWRLGGIQRAKDAFNVCRTGGSVVNKIPYTYDSFINCAGVRYYGFFEPAFANVRQRDRVIRLSFEEIIRHFKLPIVKRSNEILILGTCNDGNYFSVDKYIEQLKKALDYCLTTGKARDLAIKFHPRESEEMKNRTKSLLKQCGCRYKELPPDYMVELMLAVSEDMTILGTASTLNLYAGMMGHKSISFGKMFFPATDSLHQIGIWDQYVTEI